VTHYQVYASAPSLAVEVYAPGITDAYHPAPSGNPSLIRAEVYSPFFSGRPDGAWKGHRMYLRELAGNNWRFSWDIRDFRNVSMAGPIGVDCADAGTYPFKIRLSTNGGKSWKWLGTEGLPYGGQNLSFEWDNHWNQPAICTR
jgi:hypothetical protein